jgi:hypothetical protein
MRFPGIFKSALLGFVVFLSTSATWAQQKFPLRQGEWTMTTPDPTDPDHPMVMNFCLNDEAWSRALSPNSTCIVSDFKFNPNGATYNFTCKGASMQMSGAGTWTFDGMEHIVAKTVMTMTIGGKTKTSPAQGDFRWKKPACDPNDVNLRARQPH